MPTTSSSTIPRARSPAARRSATRPRACWTMHPGSSSRPGGPSTPAPAPWASSRGSSGPPTATRSPRGWTSRWSRTGSSRRCTRSSTADAGSDDDLGVRVDVELRGAGHDDRRLRPGLLAEHQGQFPGKPRGDVLSLSGGVAVAGHQPAFLLVQVALYPDRGVDPRGELLADDPGALDPHDVGAGRDPDRPGPAVLDPRRRSELHGLAPAERTQDVLDHQLPPVEVGLVPGDVVGVHDPGRRDDRPEPFDEGGLPGAAAAVDRAHTRPPPDAGGGLP